MRAWQGEEKEYESNDKHLAHLLYSAPPSPPSPPRSLFTGRTPEAFSYNFGQGSNNDNNIAAAPSAQIPVKANGEFIIDQTRGKSNGPISPQVTFLASQGAHVPSANNAQQSISRIFTPEKPIMPQLINYDAGNKEAEQDANKGLWRWQYGLNPNNNNNNGDKTPEKNTISRSSGDGDDIMINFSDMTSDQYTKMLQSQLEPSSTSSYLTNSNQQNYQNQAQFDTIKMMNEYPSNNMNNYYPSNNNNIQPSFSTTTQATTTISTSTSPPEITYNKVSTVLPHTPVNNISPKSFNFPSQTKSQSYDYSDNMYESKRIKTSNAAISKSITNKLNAISSSNHEQKVSYNNIWTNARDLQLHLQNEPKTITQVPQFINTVAVPKYSELQEHKSEFKPIINHKEEEHTLPITTTTTSTTTTISPESTTEDLFSTNIFLKSLVTPKKPEQKNINKIVEEPKKATHNNKITAETKADKIPKFVPYQPKSHNEFKPLKKKPSMDLSDIISYINMKNYFESSKVKPKNTYGYSNYDNRNEMRFNPSQYDSEEEDEEEYNIPEPKNHLRSINSQEQEELRGIIKNYKVLQRNNHARHTEMNTYQNRREVPQSSKMTQSAGLPPLGRAGPSMKTYLPPTYV